MRRPFSLAAYLALARGRDRQPDADQTWPERPDGPVVWLHSDTQARLETLMTVMARLRLQRRDFAMLLTSDAAGAHPFTINSDPVYAPPAETLVETQRFIAHWSPDVLIWAGNSLRPALQYEAAQKDTRSILGDAADEPWRQPSKRWVPDAAAGALSLFHQIVAQDEAAARRLRKLGVPNGRIDVASPLMEEVFPVSSHDGLHEELTAALGGRPVWLAAKIHLDEADAVLRAHRLASRLSHRLLLVIVPDTHRHEASIADMTHEFGLRLAQWDNGEMPDENTQVLLAGDDSELGLWFRLAPLSFLGGSLSGASGGQSPMMAAALGSAILYGPHVGRHLDAYSRLVSAGGARIVKDMESLSTAVTNLIAPDRAAAMAHAGWNVVSSGAETADLIIAQINDWLDAIGKAR